MVRARSLSLASPAAAGGPAASPESSSSFSAVSHAQRGARRVLDAARMASKKRTNRVGDLTTRVLIEIREEMRGMRDELRVTNERLETGFAEVNAKLDQTNARLENLRDLAGDRYRELDARIRALEARLGP
jgi:hypothetical protein